LVVGPTFVARDFRKSHSQKKYTSWYSRYANKDLKVEPPKHVTGITVIIIIIIIMVLVRM
jgi:hypothetical protein